VSFTEGRGNVIITYPGTTDKTVALIGSHLDVVPANPETWERDPYQLQREGNLLYGRGTTDCLGHVALITDMLVSLAERRPTLNRTLVVIFIVNEEASSIEGIGVDQLAKTGRMDKLKNGPVFWIDAADSQPCIGTAGMMQWAVTAHGKLFHSGLPHRGINSIELAMDAVTHLQKRFYEDFPAHEQERVYNYQIASTMKPTQIECAQGSLNQLPPHCTVSGDIRLTAFYDVKDVKAKIEQYVAELNEDLSVLGQNHGHSSRYELPDEGRKGRIELRWLMPGENGIACRIDTAGHHALLQATREVLGDVKPYSICGSLPLVRELQDEGLDVQISGYGLSARYHADNEYVDLDELKKATKILSRVVAQLETA
jgi:acetylornithine deacetylase